MRNSQNRKGSKSKAFLRDAFKQIFDIAVSSVAILISAPILGVAAVVVKVNSPGPVFYRGIRVGRHGRPFRILKFRTMVVDAELRGGSATAADDPRITPIGKFLRRYKLDELPQFFNVLVGDMSLVGPRPAVEKYATSEKEKRVLDLRPGITDWASIWDSHEEAVLEGSSDPEKAYEELIHPTKIDLQLLYLENHSFVTDFKILFHTVAKLIDDEWCPRELKPYGKIRTYKALNELPTVAQDDFPDGQIETTPPIAVGPRFRTGALESQPGNEI